MKTDAETLSVYDAKANEYAELTSSKIEEKSLEDFLADLPDGAHVLDLGCGPGKHAAFMVSNGCKVDAVDGSAEMVAKANQIEGVQARLAFFEDIDGENVYDGVWANFSLLHASRIDLPAHFSRLKQALKTGGVLHVAMKLGDGDARDRLGRRYTYVRQDELEDLLQKAGLKPYDRQLGEGVGLDGSMSEFIAVRARG